jgi:hypothetical protein
MAVRLSALRAGDPLLLGRFIVLISIRGSINFRATVRMEGLGQMKISNYLIGNRTLDFRICSTVPNPTMVPGVTHIKAVIIKKITRNNIGVVVGLERGPLSPCESK